MKAGKLFEIALKEADIDLKPGEELKVEVKGSARNLRLVVTPPRLSEFEASILKRANEFSQSKVPYQPTLSLGETIRGLRKTAGLTLESLAKKVGMSKGSLCSIEKGERQVGLIVLKKLAKVMNVPISILIK